jgi:thiol-disulfide isomerase/thioredoxin
VSENKAYSGIPLDLKRTWTVPRWLKDAFVAFAAVSIISVGVGKYFQIFGNRLERAKAAVDALDIGPAPARPIVLPKRGGGTFDLQQARGKLTLVNFWATWCEPCRQEMPSLARLAAQLEPQSFELVAVSVDDAWDPIEKFFEGKATPYTVALDKGGRTSLSYGTSKFPETYVVDAEGNVKLKFIGARDWGDGRVLALLEQLGAKRSTRSAGPEPKAHGG